MTLHIKTMVSTRCKMAVKAALDTVGLHYGMVELGEVEVQENITAEQREQLKKALSITGLELMDDKKDILISKIKSVIVEMVHYEEEVPREKISAHISKRLHHSYCYLSTQFSKAMGFTIEQYFIAHKIERAKELIMYDELTFSEIAYRLNYSSVAHLSNQFKQHTGLTPTYFRRNQAKKRIPLEYV
ncbi:MAG: helix-turn-helix transcriptional regulator [Saprospiraceae bacterium]|nr:helix-turn-helix transcriptional regulator [Saprospiraceae bacterium]